MTLAIGVDVGGTKVAAGVVDEHGGIIAKLKRSTPAASPLLTEQAIADVVTELLDHEVTAIDLYAQDTPRHAVQGFIRAHSGHLVAVRDGAAQAAGGGASRPAGRGGE